MGRQKTLWINEERNAKVESIQADSVSEKIGMCIDAYVVDEQLLVVALKAQVKYLKLFMRDVIRDIELQGNTPAAMKALARRIGEELE